MQKKIRVLAIALVAILLAPAATAKWGALGSMEPDTPQDITGGWMFQDANEEKINKVYLNVVVTQYMTSTNPNTATLAEGRYFPGHSYRFDAFYGVWIDCNLDGYVGMADTALFEYRSELLPAGSPCSPEGRHNLHNQQGWVSEMRWIGRHGGADSADPDDLPDGRDNRIISDYSSDIWGDVGLPGDKITVRNGCPINYHSTGHVLNRVDCTLAIAVDTEEATSLLDGTPLAFQRDAEGQANYDQAHPLNHGTFGEDDASRTMVTMWDCSEERHVGGLQSDQRVDPVEGPLGYKTLGVQFTDGDGELSFAVYSTTNTNGTTHRDDITAVKPGYYMPTVPALNPNGNVASTWNTTTEGALEDCDPDTRKEAFLNQYDDEYAKGPYAGETDVDTRQPGKSRVDYTFNFFEEQRSGVRKSGEPFDRGIYPGVRASLLLFFSGSRWTSPNYVPGVNAHDPEATSESLVRAYPLVRTDLEPAGARYFTFYANMSSETISTHNLELPNTGIGIYGNEWCGGETFGVVDGFNCNPDEWYVEADGSRLEDNQHQVLAGHSYRLRDIDCYDNHFVGGIYASGAYVSNEARCPSV